jgi:hypothetical protein
VFFAELPGTVGIAVASADGRTQSFGTWTSGVAWSTIKVPLVVAALRAGVSTPVDLVITDSDNAAAEELWTQLGVRAAELVQAVLREAGDPATVVESRRLRPAYTPFGQTRWSLVDQARFAAGLAQLPDAARLVELMGSLCAEHDWGLAAKGFAAKGGWGPGFGDDYLVRQFAVVPTASGVVGVALAADVPSGGYEAGIEVVGALADRVVEWLTQK